MAKRQAAQSNGPPDLDELDEPTRQLLLRLPGSVIDQLRKAARRNKRTLSAQAEIYLSEGFDKDKPPNGQR